MTGISIQRTIALLLTICLVSLPMAQSAQAAIITTDQAIELSDRTQQIARINDVLARSSIGHQSGLGKFQSTFSSAASRCRRYS